MNKPKFWVFLAGFVWILTSSLYGQTSACVTRTALIAIAGRNGDAQGTFTAADFRVTVGGKADVVLSAKPAEQAPRVAILVDASANNDQTTWAVARAMVDEFLAGLPESGDFVLVIFDDKVERVVHENHRGDVQGTLGETFPSGKRPTEAAMADALNQAKNSFGVHRQGDAELLVTTSDVIRKEKETALRQEIPLGLRFYGVSFDPSGRRGAIRFGAETVKEYTPLQAAAKESGGVWTWFPMNREDQAASQRAARMDGKTLATLVRSYVALELRIEAAITKPEKLKIDLLKGPKGKEERLVTYPQELFPCQ